MRSCPAKAGHPVRRDAALVVPVPPPRARASSGEGRPSEARPGWGPFLAPPPDTPFAFAHDVPPCLRVPRGKDQEVTPVAGQVRGVLDRPPSRTMTADQRSLGVGWMERSDTHRHQLFASLHLMMRKHRSFPSLPRERERAVGREGRSEARPGWGPFLAPPPDTPFAFAHDVPPSLRVPRGRDQEVTPAA